jgi:hypothetical protein
VVVLELVSWLEEEMLLVRWFLQRWKHCVSYTNSLTECEDFAIHGVGASLGFKEQLLPQTLGMVKHGALCSLHKPFAAHQSITRLLESSGLCLKSRVLFRVYVSR